MFLGCSDRTVDGISVLFSFKLSNEFTADWENILGFMDCHLAYILDWFYTKLDIIFFSPSSGRSLYAITMHKPLAAAAFAEPTSSGSGMSLYEWVI